MPGHILIQSPHNPLLKSVRRAVSRGGLTEDGFAVAEGFHLLEEALSSKREISAVLVSPEAETEAGRLVPSDLRIVVIDRPLFADIASTETSQGLIVLVRPAHWEPESLFRNPALLLLLDGIQDPGNLGTILRSAEAFGATGALLLKGCVNPYNPKAIRASAGSVFRVPLLAGLDVAACLSLVRTREVSLLAASPHATRSSGEVNFRTSRAIVIGSEGRGVQPELLAAAEEIRIPTEGVESLNAAVAASVLLYEASRQRRGTQ